jgi:hypothetical protein
LARSYLSQQKTKTLKPQLDIFTPMEPIQPFDAGVLGSMLQYFENPNVLLACLFEKNPQLQSIIICDTQLYRPQEVAAAKARSAQYYTSLGFAEMADNYQHHCPESISFDFEYLYPREKDWLANFWAGRFSPLSA